MSTGALGGLLDLSDLLEIDPLFERGAYDRVSRDVRQLAIGPTDRCEGVVDITTENRIRRHGFPRA